MQETFPVRERVGVSLRAEFFNAPNKANSGGPGSNVSTAANSGVITAAADPRILQLGARIAF